MTNNIHPTMARSLAGFTPKRDRTRCGCMDLCKRNLDRLDDLIGGYVVELETNPRVMFGNDPSSDVREFKVPHDIAFPVVQDFLDKNRDKLEAIMAEKMDDERRKEMGA